MAYDCAVCKKHYTTKHAAKYHAEIHHGDPNQVKPCPNNPPRLVEKDGEKKS